MMMMAEADKAEDEKRKRRAWHIFGPASGGADGGDGARGVVACFCVCGRVVWKWKQYIHVECSFSREGITSVVSSQSVCVCVCAHPQSSSFATANLNLGCTSLLPLYSI